MNDIRVQLDEYFSYVDAEQGSVDVFDVVGSVVPLPVESVPRRNLVRGGWRAAAAAAALVLVLVGGVGLLVEVANDSEDAPVVDDPVVTTTQPAVTSTTVADAADEAPVVVEEPPGEGASGAATTPWAIEDIPADAEWGTLSTPIGPAHWVHLTGDANGMPGHVWGAEAMAWPAGFAIFQPPSFTYVGDREELHPARLWVSHDGIEWHVEPLPIDPAAVEATLTLDGGIYWLTSTDPNGLWRSTDGSTWHEYDPSSLAPPGSGWSSELSGSWASGAWLVSNGDLTLMFARFSNDHGGSNTVPDDMVERLYIIGESTIEPVDVPWRGADYVTLFGVEGFVYAYSVIEQSGPEGIVGGDISVWRTTDGRSWTDLGPLSLPDRPPSHLARFASAGDTLTITFFDTSFFDRSSSRSGHDTAWETTDGVNWTPLPSGRPEGTHPVHVESGWFSTVGDEGGPVGGQAWWMNVEQSWVSLAELRIGVCGGSELSAAGDTTFIHCRSARGDLWILNLDSP